MDNLISLRQRFLPDAGVIETSQTIPSDFLTDLAERRQRSHNERSGEFMHVASIPVAVVHKWLKEGFDLYRAEPREIVAKLRREDLTAFLATDKRV